MRDPKRDSRAPEHPRSGSNSAPEEQIPEQHTEAVIGNEENDLEDLSKDLFYRSREVTELAEKLGGVVAEVEFLRRETQRSFIQASRSAPEQNARLETGNEAPEQNARLERS